MLLHVVYTKEGVYLSKRDYPSWREIQDAFAGYMASEGPWNTEATVQALTLEYSGLHPSAQHQVEAFLESPDMVRIVTFGDQGPNYSPSQKG
jgi:hypothetical protein